MRRSVLRYPNFRRLWASLAASELGDHFFEVAVAVYALKMHHSALTLGTILAVGTLPKMTLGWLVAGVIDKWHKQHVMMAADWLRMLVVISLAWFHPLWWAMSAVFLLQFLGMFFLPASRAILPETVSPSDLDRANSTLGTTITSLSLVGYASASLVVSRFGIAPAFIFDSLTFVISSLWIAQMRLAQSVWRPVAAGPPRFWQEIWAGVAFHRRQPVVFDLLWLSALGVLAMFSLNVLAGPIAIQRLGRAPSFYGYLMLALGLGTVIGAQLTHWVGSRLSRRIWVGLGFATVGAAFLGLVAAHTLWAGLGCFVLGGVGNMLAQIPMRSWILAETPAEFRGRVFAARSMVIAVAGGVSMGSAGIASNAWGLGTALAVYGCIGIAAGVGVWLRPALRADSERSATRVTG
ncbi:MAG: MFS transporter [Thermaerobacter sp.]|nr:MFS transporter [Thermaerobacter sp.]